MRSKLIELRKEKGFTRKSIAEELKITESFYGKLKGVIETLHLNWQKTSQNY